MYIVARGCISWIRFLANEKRNLIVSVYRSGIHARSLIKFLYVHLKWKYSEFLNEVDVWKQWNPVFSLYSIAMLGIDVLLEQQTKTTKKGGRYS